MKHGSSHLTFIVKIIRSFKKTVATMKKMYWADADNDDANLIDKLSKSSVLVKKILKKSLKTGQRTKFLNINFNIKK